MQRQWFAGAALAALLAAGPVVAQDSVPGTPYEGPPGAVATAPADIEMAQALDLFASGNYAEGMTHLLKAAEAGNLSAQVMLGMLYLHGSPLYNLDIAADPEAARAWLTLAALAGSPIAKYMLAELDLFTPPPAPQRTPQRAIIPLIRRPG